MVVDGLYGLVVGYCILVMIFVCDLDGFDGGVIKEVLGSLGVIKGYLDGFISFGINIGWIMMGGGFDQVIV